ncbi:MAG: chemotaxis protein CheX [Methylococcales bacterium]|nr:chemotaxis protein CheX [Methylococcales bacterium]MDD5754008.1 chemotaxis protein CheX [Methylococcales bacterium]
MSEKQLIIEVMESVTKRTYAYFKSEFGIETTECNSVSGKLDALVLLDMTVVIIMGGKINLLVVFSFEASLINAIYRKMIDGLSIEDHEVETYRKAAAGDVINTVLGHSTIDLLRLDKNGISITPPRILKDVNVIRAMKCKMFYAQSLSTPLGGMTISLVGSQELFDTVF